jgi:hypothetical protein
MDRINPGMGLIGEKSLLYVLKSTSTKPIFVNEFVDQAQTILFDDIGSVGHFRLAPARREDLTENFVLGSHSHRKQIEFMPRGNNELHVAFFVREDLPETPLSKELEIIPQELKCFCQETGLSFEQVDVRYLYPANAA